MSIEPKKDNPMADRQLEAPDPISRRPARRRASPPANRSEAQLRFDVVELEARLAEVSRCLQGAEERAAEAAHARDELAAGLADIELRFAVIVNSRSWRLTSPLRTIGRRLRTLIKG
jgi:hypothetical protein